MTRLLVEGGANLDAVDVNGNGVVHAAVCDSPAVLAILIDSGADVTLPNNDGVTPKVGPRIALLGAFFVLVLAVSVWFP